MNRDEFAKKFIEFCNEYCVKDYYAEAKCIMDDIYDKHYSRVDPIYKLIYKGKHYVSNSLKDLLDKVKDGNIILYMVNINKYILFDSLHQYETFRGDYACEIDDRDNDKTRFERYNNIPKYLIVFTTDPQKLVLSFSSKESNETIEQYDKEVAAIAAYIKEYFKCEIYKTFNVSWGKSQFIVDMRVNSFNEIPDLCNKIKDHILQERRIKENVIDKLDIPPIKSINGRTYIMVSLTSPVENELISMTPVILDATNSVINITNIIGNNNNVNINNAATKSESAADKTVKWIKDNPPSSRELSNDYYKKYKDYVSANKLSKLSIQKFTRLVKENGHEKGRDGKVNFWVG